MSCPSANPSAAAVLADAVSAAGADPAAVISRHAVGNDVLRQAAEICMRRQQWAAAAALLASPALADPSAELQRRVSANLAELRTCRPATYAALMACAGSNRYAIMPTARGQPTVVYRGHDGRNFSLSGSDDPAGDAARAVAAMVNAGRHKETIGLGGMGDGYLLYALSRCRPGLLFNQQPPIFLVEPDGALLLTCLMMHDYTGPDGPIRQDRFIWLVGPQWHQQLRDLLAQDPFLLPPLIWLHTTQQQADIEAHVAAVYSELEQRNTDLAADISAYYSSLSRRHYLEIFSESPPRPPRVLLLTSRFTSVLRYSTADAAAAFEELGWKTEILIEPSDCRRLTTTAIRKALAGFKPDLIFQIDYLRRDHNNLIPPDVPFVCWIQDALPNLATPDAGRFIGRRDYVMTIQPIYEHRYGYPPRQIIPLHRFTRIVRDMPESSRKGDDLAYVSNASMPPEEMAAAMVREQAGNPRLQRLIDACCHLMIETYRRGECLQTFSEVGRMLASAESQCGMHIDHAGLRQNVIDALFNRLNNLLYRQQALLWASQLAGEMGFTLALYGRDWEKHPLLAPHARGPVSYGKELAALSRRTRINLKIEPYLCVSHQRLLDGLAAGGFFLVRDHIANRLVAELAAFMERHGLADAPDSEHAMKSLGDQARRELAALLKRWEVLADTGDPVDQVRRCRRAGLVADGGELLPHLDQIIFSDKESLARLINRFLGDEGLRRSIADSQRRSIEARLSYTAGMGRLVAEIRRLIAAEEPMEDACGSAT